MLRSRHLVGTLSISILLASVGCSIGHRPNAQTHGYLPPDRLMAMADTFERQGRMLQAKNAYLQILAVQPEFPDARQRLDTLIASEMNHDRTWFDLSKVPDSTLVASPKKEEEDKSSATVSKKPHRLVKREATKSAPRLMSHDSNVANAEEQKIESVKSDLELPKLETMPRILETDLNRIHPVPPKSRIEALIKPRTVHSELIPNDHPPVRENDQPTNAIPELLSTASSPAHSDQLPPLTVQLPFVADQPPNEYCQPIEPAAADRNESPSEEQIEFVRPGIRVDRVTDVELSKLFGSFHIEMIQTLKQNRDRIQSQLVEMVCDRETVVEVRSRAIFLLGAIGREAVDALPSLRRKMHDDSDPLLKVDLCEAILKIQPEDEDAIRALVECLHHYDAEVRWIAVFALRNAVSPRTTFVIDSLREVLKTEDLKLRRMVFLTLAEFGPAASAALPELNSALESTDRATRDVAKASLESIALDRMSMSLPE